MKPMFYKDEEGKEYKISFSEELQMKNLRATRDNVVWLRRNFYIKLILSLIVFGLTAAFIFTLYRLDSVNFFSGILFR